VITTNFETGHVEAGPVETGLPIGGHGRALPRENVRYRPDIDGLRALAIAPVLLFHVDVRGFAGGYVGVDIFFVISGFLISQIIARQLASGDFSLAGFYAQRVRRIFPALFAMIAATIAVGSQILLPMDFGRLGISALSTTLFASNLYFARHTGYFGSGAEDSPLLHSWSLAVEEQYYILFPLLMLIVFRYGARYRLVCMALAAISFASCVLLVAWAPTDAFYLPISRAWEFLAGAVLGIGRVPQFRSQRQALVAGVAGAGLIGWAIFTFSAATVFPGFNALFPVVGAMLLIHSGGAGSVVSRVLSLPVPVFLGRISYSLYLWHWPMIVFWKYRTDGQWRAWEQAALIVASLIVAVLSWRFIEEPFRRSSKRDVHATFRFAAIMLVAGCSIGAFLHVSKGMPERMTPTVVALDAATQSMADLPKHCTGIAPVRERSLCAVGGGTARASFLLWGDSHAQALKPAFDHAADRLGMTGQIASYPACPTLLGLDRMDQPASHDCSEFNRLVIAMLATEPEITTVVLVSRWGLCANGERPEGGMPCYLGREPDDAMTFANNNLLFDSGLFATVEALKKMGKRVILMAPIPEFQSSVPKTLARASMYEEPMWLSLSHAQYLQRERPVLNAFALLQLRLGVTVVYPDRLLCRTGTCQMMVDGVPLYADDDHLSVRGSMMLSGMIEDAMRGVVSRS
jgi:peptidoglycan/LPS O-acetylase OafA/YrhL